MHGTMINDALPEKKCSPEARAAQEVVSSVTRNVQVRPQSEMWQKDSYAG